MKTKVTLERLTDFIVEAKLTAWASKNAIEVEPERPGHKELIYEKDGLFYIDSYTAFFQAPGMEEVRFESREGPTIWSLSYSGGMLPGFQEDIEYAKHVFDECLKPALRLVSLVNPFRGPPFHRSKSDPNLVYLSNVQGNLKRFKLDEGIFDLSKSSYVFNQDCIGGLVIEK